MRVRIVSTYCITGRGNVRGRLLYIQPDPQYILEYSVLQSALSVFITSLHSYAGNSSLKDALLTLGHYRCRQRRFRCCYSRTLPRPGFSPAGWPHQPPKFSWRCASCPGEGHSGCERSEYHSGLRRMCFTSTSRADMLMKTTESQRSLHRASSRLPSRKW